MWIFNKFSESQRIPLKPGFYIVHERNHAEGGGILIGIYFPFSFFFSFSIISFLFCSFISHPSLFPKCIFSYFIILKRISFKLRKQILSLLSKCKFISWRLFYFIFYFLFSPKRQIFPPAWKSLLRSNFRFACFALVIFSFAE